MYASKFDETLSKLLFPKLKCLAAFRCRPNYTSITLKPEFATYIILSVLSSLVWIVLTSLVYCEGFNESEAIRYAALNVRRNDWCVVTIEIIAVMLASTMHEFWNIKLHEARYRPMHIHLSHCNPYRPFIPEFYFTFYNLVFLSRSRRPQTCVQMPSSLNKIR